MSSSGPDPPESRPASTVRVDSSTSIVVKLHVGFEGEFDSIDEGLIQLPTPPAFSNITSCVFGCAFTLWITWLTIKANSEIPNNWFLAFACALTLLSVVLFLLDRKAKSDHNKALESLQKKIASIKKRCLERSIDIGAEK